MSSTRMIGRVPSAKSLGRARLDNKRMVCNKRSKNGSGKANVQDSPGEVAWGVLYEISSKELANLDKAEGGYDRVSLQVWTSDDVPVEAEVYISRMLTDDPKPFDWYKEFIVSGAQEHRLPESYIEYLKRLPSKR